MCPPRAGCYRPVMLVASRALVDRGLEHVLGAIGRLQVSPPGRAALGRHRAALLHELVDERRARWQSACEGVARRDPESIAAFDACVERALEALRGSRPRDVVGAAAHLADRAFYKNVEEWLDDPTFDERERVHLLATLDRFNEHLGSYASWTRLVQPLVERSPQRPTHIGEIAAGHGAFSLWLARAFQGFARVTATDLRAEYLALARPQADVLGVALRTMDATDLSPLAEEGVDVLVCTQSLHHFPPGLVSRFIGEASRVARVGVCFIDAERSALALLVVSPLMLAYGRSYALFHDAAASLRRMYTAEELALLARLAPGLPAQARVEWGRVSPGFAYVRVWST